MNDQSIGAENPTLSDYVRPLWARKWLILAIVVAATAGTYAFFANKPSRYSSKTELFVKASQLDLAILGNPTDSSSADRDLANQAVLIHSRPVAVEAKRLTGLPGSPEVLLKKVKVAPQQGTDFVSISAVDDDPRTAARLANGMAMGYIAVRTRQVAGTIEQALRTARQHVKRARTSPTPGEDLSDLRTRVRTLELLQAVPPEPVSQLEAAKPPSGRSYPRPKRNAVFAFVVSLFLAGVAAFGLDRLDRRLRRVDEIEGAFKAPLIGVLTHTRNPSPVRYHRAQLPDDLREAYRSLRSNLQLVSLDQRVKRILVTSAVPGEGKSTVVRNLALAYRELGMNVAAVDADLRRPGLSRLFGVPAAGPGLVRALADESLDGSLVDLSEPARTGALASSHTAVSLSPGRDGGGSLVLLPGGPPPPNPQVLLGSHRMTSLLDHFGESCDVVLIDSSPLLAVSDAIPLLSLVDGVLVIARLKLTTRDAAKRLRELLELVPTAPVLGVVANDVPSMDTGAWSYQAYEYPLNHRRRRLGLRRRTDASAPGATPVASEVRYERK